MELDSKAKEKFMETLEKYVNMSFERLGEIASLAKLIYDAEKSGLEITTESVEKAVKKALGVI